jgi:hypothetical protein
VFKEQGLGFGGLGVEIIRRSPLTVQRSHVGVHGSPFAVLGSRWIAREGQANREARSVNEEHRTMNDELWLLIFIGAHLPFIICVHQW